MSNYLTKPKKDILYKNKKGDIILYNPTIEQWDDIKNLIKNSTKKDEKGNLVMDENNINYLYYIYKNLTTLSNEVENMTIEDFKNNMNNKLFIENNRPMIRLYRKIKELIIDEIVDDIKYEMNEMLDTISTLIDEANVVEKREEVIQKLKNFLKEHNIDIDSKEYKDVIKNIKNLEELKKKENNKKTNNKKENNNSLDVKNN